MLSNIYLLKYKKSKDLSSYLEEEEEKHKELSLPRFKLVKEFGKDVKHLETFVPFIKERDQMNRLTRVHSETKKTAQSHSLGRRHSPDGHWYFNENYVLPEKRRKANLKFNYQVALDYQIPQTQRTVIDESIPVIKPTPVTFLRSNIKKRTKVNKSPIPLVNEEPKKFQIQLPSQVLQPYINREMEAMKQDLFLKVDMDYHFPSDLSDKLIQQKQQYILIWRHIEVLRRRLKEWGETKSPEDIQDLKEYAQYILSKNT